MVIASAGGPNWTETLTAFGTVGAVVAALMIALMSELWSRNRLRIERRLSLDREQWAEAYAVQVTDALILVVPAQAEKGRDSDGFAASPVVFLVNLGSYAITMVDSRFSDGKTIYGPYERTRLSAFGSLPEELRGDAAPNPGTLATWTLAPGDPGMRLAGRPMRIKGEMYSVVRWRDRWGSSWESRHGGVCRIGDIDEAWMP